MAFHLFELVVLAPNVVKANVHVHFTKGGTPLEKGQVVKAVGDRDIVCRRAAQFFRAEKAMIKIDESRRVLGEICNVAKSCHKKSSWGIGTMEYWNIADSIFQKGVSIIPSLQDSTVPVLF